MSEKYLVIVESPVKCSKIQYYLQQIDPQALFLVRACCGHFREIQSIHPTTFNIQFQMMRIVEEIPPKTKVKLKMKL